ncbi:MAG: oxygen-independent coproporphyrinogen III oxidase [Bacteroidota bacterium]
MNTSLLAKYNIPAPRYTSYPTVPYWQSEAPSQTEWKSHVVQAFEQNNEISLYIHLPYCEQLCTYCGCNKRITKNHKVEDPYIDTVLAEWALYKALLPGKPILKEVHLGGGTPTFFSPEALKRLLSTIYADVTIAEDCEMGFEAHPGTTERRHLESLAKLGFKRLSIGIQDFAPEILLLINRSQTYDQVAEVTKWARELGYTSINYDLIFGLPKQTKAHILENMTRLAELRPERLAFYSYAHVPWIKPSQRAYSEADLPKGAEKRALYDLGRTLLEEIGYQEIGMDHFALPHDGLSKALKAGALHRNFMGYTPFDTTLNLAIGASSIGDSWTAFVQNEKKIEDYQEKVNQGIFPILKGHLLSYEDQILRRHILNMMCLYETEWSFSEQELLEPALERLEELEKDGLVIMQPNGISVTPLGQPFIRNICLAFDGRYWSKKPEGQLFSQVV